MPDIQPRKPVGSPASTGGEFDRKQGSAPVSTLTPAPWVRREPPLVEHSLSATQTSIYSFLMPTRRADFDVSAPYQRGSVWTVDQQRALIRSTIQRLPTGSIVYSHDESSPEPPFYRVIDGKQRLQTLWAFADGDFAVPADWFPDEDIDPASVDGDGGVRFAGLSQRGRRGFENNTIAVIELDSGRMSVRVEPGTGTGGSDKSWATKYRTRAQAIAYEAEVFDLLNTGGTLMGDADIDNARKVAGI